MAGASLLDLHADAHIVDPPQHRRFNPLKFTKHSYAQIACNGDGQVPPIENVEKIKQCLLSKFTGLELVDVIYEEMKGLAVPCTLPHQRRFIPQFSRL